MRNKREIVFYKDYFEEFYETLSDRVKKKILWTFRLIRELDRIPDSYLKHLEGTDGLYEIRAQQGNNIYRIFCFFDKNNLIIIGNAFQKKSQKTPANEVARALRIKKEYYEETEKKHDHT